MPAFIALFMALFIAAFTQSAAAQAVTPAQAGAGEHLRQQERERQLRQKQERIPDVHFAVPASPGPERLPAGEAACVDVRGIHLVGDSAESFLWAVDHAHFTGQGVPDAATGRCLGTQGINLVMRRIQNALVAEGFVAARVLAGPQERLSEGILELTLFPGRIRQVRFVPGTDDRATQWNAVPARPGDLLNLRDIEQALENFKRVPTAEADIEVVPAEGPGARPGESDLVIHWRQGLPFRLSLSADDSGTRATGKYQGNVTLSYDHWWTLNDLFYVSLNHNLHGGASAGSGRYGTRGHTVHYSLPFGYWLLGLTAGANRYRQSVPGASQTYLYSGMSRTGEIGLSRLVHRDAVRKTTLSLRAWVRSSRNFIDDTEVEVQRRRMAGVDIGIGHREFIGAATMDLNLNRRRGTGAAGSLPAPEEAFGEGTSRPDLITADAQLNAPFSVAGQRLRYTGNWRAQWNRTPLVPQDRFAIGGRYTVRGFDGESQLLAERGWLVRNDLSWAVAQSGQEFYLGIDHGEVGGPAAAALAGSRLSGAVIGLRGGAGHFHFDVFAGAPLRKPEAFRTARRAVGVSLTASF